MNVLLIYNLFFLQQNETHLADSATPGTVVYNSNHPAQPSVTNSFRQLLKSPINMNISPTQRNSPKEKRTFYL
jgi:hypothetical protein